MRSSPYLPFSILTRYFLREFLQVFCLCLFSFLSLYVMVDFFDHLHVFLDHSASLSSLVRYYLYKLPLILTHVIPPAMLAGSLLSLTLLGRHNELLALRACGQNLWQFSASLLMAAVLLSTGSLIWNETLVPYCSQRAHAIYTVEVKKKSPQGLFLHRGIWYHGKRAFYNIDYFDARNAMLFGLTLYQVDREFRLQRLIEVDEARWDGNQWTMGNVSEKTFSADGDIFVRPLRLAEVLLEETPEDFTLVRKEAEEFDFRSLRRYIHNLRQKGLDMTEYVVDLHLKLSVPFAAALMAFIAVPLVASNRRHVSWAGATALALFIGFSYWVILALAVSLGHSGALPPAVAAWFANGLFLCVGLFFFLGAE